MSRLKRLLTIAFVLVLSAGFIAAYGTFPEQAFAAGDYTYTVKVYSGSEGYFDGDPDKHVKVISGEGYKSGEEYSIDVNDLDLTLIHPDKFYARGVKIAGHDNDDRIFQSGTFWATRDESYSVAYGMAGGMVKYTVRYVDKSGRELHAPGEYYGMAGDKPVVSYQYIEGYLPQAYNLGKTISADESANVFEFVYDKAGDIAGDADTDEDTEDNNDTDARNNEANRTVEAGTNVNRETNGNNDNEPAEYIDLDDPDTPLADNADNGSGDEKSGFSSLPIGAKIAIIAALVIAAAAAAVAIVRRNMYEYVYEDDDDGDGESESGNE